MELLSAALKFNPKIKGISINNSEFLISQYADDSTLSLANDENSLIRVITKLPNSEQSYKGKVKTHNYTNRQNQSTTGKL